MPLEITARFVIGTYQGRSTSGSPEPYPSTDRLLACLVAAAGASPHATEAEGVLQISDRHAAAIRWLEENPPDHVDIPVYALNVPDAVAFRKTGLRFRGEYAPANSAAAVARSALAGPFTWSWDQEPAPDIVKALDELCQEAGYLGEAASLAALSAATVASVPRDRLSRLPEGEMFVTGAVPIQTALPGRLEHLRQVHDAAVAPMRRPERASATSEEEAVATWPTEAVRLVWYAPQPDERPALVPWDRALVLEVSNEDSRNAVWPPPVTEYVGWAVALHRALVRTMHPHVPPLVSGHYPPGDLLPANRLAIHVVTDSMSLGWKLSNGVKAAFAVLLPHDTAPEDQDRVVRAMLALSERGLYRGAAGKVRLARIRAVPADEFWAPVPEGMTRWWQTYPLAVADTRPLTLPGGRKWGLEDALRLSVAMVWRRLPPVSERVSREAVPTGTARTAYYAALADAAAEHVTVGESVQVVGSGLERFAHKTNSSTVLTAYSASLRLTGLGNERAPVAIGQSRHLGGGLLVPSDRADDAGEGAARA